MALESLKKNRKKFVSTVFLYSCCASLILSITLYLTSGLKAATSFILSSIFVQIDIWLITVLSGALFDSNKASYAKITLFLLVKILLLTAGLYGILYFFKGEFLYVFLGLSLPIAILALIGLFDRSK